MQPVDITRDTWYDLVDVVRKKSGAKIPVWSCIVNNYNVCVPSLVTPLSVILWNLHQSLNGTKNETYESYYNLPAFWVSACQIIDSEISRMDRIRAKQESQTQAKLMRKLNSGNK